MARSIHEDMFGYELSIVFVRRSHKDLKTSLFPFLSESTDDIIRLKSGHFEHRDIHRLEYIFDYRNGFTNIFGGFGSLRFVLLICFMAERAPCGVKSHTDVRRVDFFEQVFERHRKAENSGSVLSLTVHSRCTNEGIVCAKNHRVSIN